MKELKKHRNLYTLVGRVFDALWQRYDSIGEIAQASGLGYETVRRLAMSETKYPRAQTVVMLAEAGGQHVSLLDCRKAGAA